MMRFTSRHRWQDQGERRSLQASINRLIVASALPVLLTALSCGGGPGTPAAPSGPAPQPPTVPTPPAPPPLPPEIGSPCPGAVVRGNPPERDSSVTRATLLIDWEQPSGGGFDWAGPYYDDEDDPEDRSRYPLLEVNVAEWRVETVEGATRHTLGIEWPPFLEVGLLFRSGMGACALPQLVCSGLGCELRPFSR